MAKTVKFKIALGTGISEVEGYIKTFKECPNEEFGFRKSYTDNWEVTHIRSGFQVTQGKTQKECIAKLQEIFKDEQKLKIIHDAKTIEEMIEQYNKDLEKRAKKNKKFQKLRNEFQELTGITVPIDPLIGGLDIVRLDRKLQTPDNVSMADFLKNKYGERASKIVDEMISNI